MKILTFVLSITMAMPAGAVVGSGLPSDECAYGETFVTPAKPQSVINAEAKLAAVVKKKEKLEKKLEKIDCDGCAENFKKIIDIVDSGTIVSYENHMSGGGACTPTASNVLIYNYWATINNWEQIELKPRKRDLNRMIAGGTGDMPVVNELTGVSHSSQSPGTANVSAPAFAPQCPKYARSNGSVDKIICDLARDTNNNGTAAINRAERLLCRKCLRTSPRYKSGRYPACLSGAALLAELEDEISELEDELEEAIDIAEENGEKPVKKKKVKKFFKKYGPTIGVASIVGLGAWLARRSVKKSYDYYQNVTVPDNNAKGYPTSYVKDRSGVAAATVLLAGAPMVINTAAKSGVFGCAQAANAAGAGAAGAGAGAAGAFGGLFGVGGGGLFDLIGQIQGGGTGTTTNGAAVVNTSGGYTIGANGQPISNSGGLTAAQIQAQIAQGNQELAALQARQASLAQYYSYINSRAAVDQQYQANIVALGPAPAFSGGRWVNGRWVNGSTQAGIFGIGGSSVVQGSVNLNVGLGVGSRGGFAPPFNNGGNRINTPPYNPNVGTPPTNTAPRITNF